MNDRKLSNKVSFSRHVKSWSLQWASSCAILAMNDFVQSKRLIYTVSQNRIGCPSFCKFFQLDKAEGLTSRLWHQVARTHWQSAPPNTAIERHQSVIFLRHAHCYLSTITIFDQGSLLHNAPVCPVIHHMKISHHFAVCQVDLCGLIQNSRRSSTVASVIPLWAQEA